MKFDELLELLEKNNSNSIDFYTKHDRTSKKFTEVAIDVKKTIFYLKRLSVSKNERIGILSDNCYEYILLDLACIYLGITTVHFHKNEHLTDDNSIIKYGIKYVFLKELNDPNYQPNNKIIPLKTLIASLNNYTNELELEPFERNEKYSIVFSSGTTGMPKAMEISTKGIEEFCYSFIKSFKLNSEDKILNILPLSIITARMYLYSSILGGTNIIFSDTDKFSNALRIYKPTFFQSVPHLFEGIHQSFYQIMTSPWKNKITYQFFIAIKNLLPKKFRIKIQKLLFKEIHTFFGEKMKILVTGSAPINIKTLLFFDNIGIRLYEAYGLTEIGVITTNTPNNYKIGSVGKKFGDKEIILDENNQVLVKSKFPFTDNYINSEEITKQVFRSDGYINTGDIGFFDSKGYLYLNGRIKEIIVLTNGNKLFPNNIEKELERFAEIKQCMLYGNNKPYLVALVVGDSNNKNAIENRIKEINKINNNDYQIKGLSITQEPFTLDNELLSNNMKKNRENIYKKYKQQIEELY